MKDEDKKRIEKYTAAMNFFILAFNRGVIDVNDYHKAEQHIADKYGLTDGDTYRRIEPFDENLYGRPNKRTTLQSKRITKCKKM